MIGRLSPAVRGWRQVRQREFGQRRLFSSGSRPTTTFRKLPTAGPRTNAQVSPDDFGQRVGHAARIASAACSGDNAPTGTTTSAHAR